MSNDKLMLLNELEFENVDSESEEDLDAKFIKTEDINSFIKPQKSINFRCKRV